LAEKLVEVVVGVERVRGIHQTEEFISIKVQLGDRGGKSSSVTKTILRDDLGP
jgi:hypothetical protein